MKFATVRDLRINASRVMEDAKTEEVVVTRRGRPLILLVSISEENIEEVIQAVRAARLRASLEDLWEESRESGADKITGEEIDAEIREYRKEKNSLGSP